MDVMNAAIWQAQERANREHSRMTVYHSARDRYGRDAVFFVRSVYEGPPVSETLGNYQTVTHCDPDCQNARKS